MALEKKSVFIRIETERENTGPGCHATGGLRIPSQAELYRETLSQKIN
jgi:hypothetical protein